MRAELRESVAKIVEMLVRGQYSEIERRTDGRRLRACDIENAVREYGKTLRMPPGGKLDLDVIQVSGRTPPTWSVRVDLWTIEEGRSDLTLELTVVDRLGDAMVEVDNLHVL